MMIEHVDLKDIRQKLLKERARLRRSALPKQSGTDPQQQRNLDRADLAQSYTQQERKVLLADRERMQLAKIEAALQKIADERYGFCDNCQQPIASGRLAVLPYANLCIHCQSKHEN